MNPRSAALVAAQFALAAVLLLTTRLPAPGIRTGLAAAVALAAVALGVAALAANRPGNFNIRPEPKENARLITHGVYRHLRHPMYAAFLLFFLAALLLDARPGRIALWLALLAVLVLKARREEALLRERFAEYGDYMRRTKRFLPGLY
ncbi:MAG: NnrU family protein [Burkholderiaceae bacterium]|nr:NnrU family protein [Burkholderiaceae bacterium]